ncbi:uncharacterized protein LOC116662134 isoform X10 [Camelus ferus]|uniref:Uncharacterized protein LOC116662134 isoform X10 n=1 Tax=Camelus ferus TaxID=419612 RepID=A0A8B8SNB8_CAMFR|nr:uncharacterized protein LOC116662134 isoform X10 [Camelus ferus]
MERIPLEDSRKIKRWMGRHVGSEGGAAMERCSERLLAMKMKEVVGHKLRKCISQNPEPRADRWPSRACPRLDASWTAGPKLQLRARDQSQWLLGSVARSSSVAWTLFPGAEILWL